MIKNICIDNIVNVSVDYDIDFYVIGGGSF